MYLLLYLYFVFVCVVSVKWEEVSVFCCVFLTVSCYLVVAGLMCMWVVLFCDLLYMFVMSLLYLFYVCCMFAL